MHMQPYILILYSICLTHISFFVSDVRNNLFWCQTVHIFSQFFIKDSLTLELGIACNK
jgi:hypothetical protein